MATREEQLNKDKKKALGELLIGECRAEKPNLETLGVILDSGADVTYNYAKGMYWACKAFKFDVAMFLVKEGALKEPMCKTYISNICNYKNYKQFEEQLEPQYFALMEKCVDFYGDRVGVYTPYIIYMAVHGRLNKLYELMENYYLTESEVARSIPVPIIFEIILHNYEDVLNFINKHVKWISQSAFDRAVERGDWISLEYMVNNSDIKEASYDAVSRAVFFGEAEVIDILVNLGLRLEGDERFLKSACDASRSGSTKALEVLLKRGFKITDKYGGKTLRQNAELDKNTTLLEFLNKTGG